MVELRWLHYAELSPNGPAGTRVLQYRKGKVRPTALVPQALPVFGGLRTVEETPDVEWSAWRDVPVVLA